MEFDVTPPNFIAQLRKWGVPRDGWQDFVDHQADPCPDIMLDVTRGNFRECAAEILRSRDTNHDVDKTFALFENGSGLITIDDLRRVSSAIGRDDISDDTLRTMISTFDVAGKGGVNKAEFRAMMKQAR